MKITQSFVFGILLIGIGLGLLSSLGIGIGAVMQSNVLNADNAKSAMTSNEIKKYSNGCVRAATTSIIIGGLLLIYDFIMQKKNLR